MERLAKLALAGLCQYEVISLASQLSRRRLPTLSELTGVRYRTLPPLERAALLFLAGVLVDRHLAPMIREAISGTG